MGRLIAVGFSSMRTSRPTARSAFAFQKLGADSLDVLLSYFRLLDGDNPADPFVASERSEVVPGFSDFGCSVERLAQVCGYLVDDSCSNC